MKIRYFYLVLFIFAVSVSSFAQSWTPQNSGVTETFRHVYFTDASTGYAVGYDLLSVLKTTDGGASWSKLQVGNISKGFIGCFFLNKSTGFIGGDDGIYKTTDGGATWTQTGFGSNYTNIFFVNSTLGFAVGGTTGKEASLDVTTDGGNSWSHKSTSSFSRLYGLFFINDKIGWAADDKNVILKTTNGGVDWQPVYSNSGAGSIRFSDEKNGWAVGNDKLLRTTDGGATWNNVSPIKPGYKHALMSVTCTDANTAWVVGAIDSTGSNDIHALILKTTDGGATWANQAGQSRIIPRDIFMLDENHGWIVGEKGAILVYSGTSDVKTSDGASAPKDFSLGQNYPNPFNPSTKISYALPAECNVKIQVYSIAGQLVGELVNGVQPAGNYEASFNASNLSSGMYIYRITAVSSDGNLQFSDTRKMMMIK